METNIYEIAFAEVYEIFKMMDKKDLEKIPNDFKKMIETNKSNNYIPQIDKTVPLYKQELRKETLAICSLIYRNYLASDEKKKELAEKDRKELMQLEEELRKKYNPEQIFKNKENNNNIPKVQLESKTPDNIFIQFIRKLSKIFKREK